MKFAKLALVIAAGVMLNSGAAHACSAQTAGSIGNSQQGSANVVAGLLARTTSGSTTSSSAR